jgi:iron complex outermembrane recepter protein
MLVLINRCTVYTPVFASVLWHAQDYALDDIDCIEVVSHLGGTPRRINIKPRASKETRECAQ